MTKPFLLAWVALCLSIVVHASDDDKTLPGVLDGSSAPKTGPCSELKLNAGEKSKIKELHFKFKESKIDLVARVEKARLKYELLVADPKSEIPAARLASQEVVSAVVSIMQSEENYKNEVLFEVLKPAQRSAANLCLKELSWKSFARGKGAARESAKDPAKDSE